MRPQNPIFEDNVNVSKTHPLVDLLWLGGGAVFIVVLATVLLYGAMTWIAPYVPFSWEQKLVSQVNIVADVEVETDTARVGYLQDLADKLAKAQALDDDISITVHWLDDDIPNAFATLGGHVFVTKGLWDMMPDENALAMVLAHEIAHVKHRDALKGLGAGVALSLLNTIVFGASDTGLSLLGSSGLITSLSFSRSMETAADKAAIETLYKHYGHVSGSTEFFESILEMQFEMPEFLQTHPLTQARIDALVEIQKEQRWPVQPAAVLPLPE